MRGRQRGGMIAKVVLAELAGVVAEVELELGERRGSGSQVGPAARNLRTTMPVRTGYYTGEEGITAGGAALHGHVVHEDGAFLPDVVDVGGFPNHQAAMEGCRPLPASI